MTPEVLIYIQSIKNFFDQNEEARQYFLTNVDEDTFFQCVTEISEKNYEKNGDATLTQLEFELIKRSLTIHSKTETPEEIKTYFETNGFGRVYLN